MSVSVNLRNVLTQVIRVSYQFTVAHGDSSSVERLIVLNRYVNNYSMLTSRLLKCSLQYQNKARKTREADTVSYDSRMNTLLIIPPAISL